MKFASISARKNLEPTAKQPAALLLLLLFLLTIALPQAQARKITVRRLNPPGSTYTFAWDLNNKGKVVGSFVDANSVFEGFIYDGAKFKTFVFSKSATLTQANGINDSNVVVGDYTGADQLSHGFFLRNGKLTSYDLQKGASTYIYRINNAGNFTGYSNKQGERANAFINIGGKVTQFNFGSNYTFAFGLNNKNETVGMFIDSSFNTHGFHRDAAGKMTQIDYPGAPITVCLGINDLDEIVGYFVDTSSVQHGFTMKNGNFRPSSLPAIDGINNAGVFVGWYAAQGTANGYIATPR